jgi:hypothetical protein
MKGVENVHKKHQEHHTELHNNSATPDNGGSPGRNSK